ncbi:hypothetical protein [Pseudoalteromonas umbrosa]|uniref:hypothetical protein n=1 Tax=Pseudoalteromonas umbrosa TaxID=3048489 RepID=UPI0024C21238|nr:hypothetical protein [Pseudoalteromonas sp. B95]MDK1287696.1 hypothetical protein [Pseudoalteromonas sp. B95]
MKNEDGLKVVVVVANNKADHSTQRQKQPASKLELISVIAASLAVIIGLITVYFSQNHNKQSVKPLLSAWHAQNSDGTSITWNVYNAGLGPAKIKIAKAFIQDKEVDGYLGSLHVWEALKLNEQMKVDVKWSSLIVPNDIIKDGDDAKLLTITWSDGIKIPKNYDADYQLVLAYCYCSVYDECLYEDTRSGGHHKPLFACS